jgi:hypothetical protein
VALCHLSQLAGLVVGGLVVRLPFLEVERLILVLVARDHLIGDGRAAPLAEFQRAIAILVELLKVSGGLAGVLLLAHALRVLGVHLSPADVISSLVIF